MHQGESNIGTVQSVARNGVKISPAALTILRFDCPQFLCVSWWNAEGVCLSFRLKIMASTLVEFLIVSWCRQRRRVLQKDLFTRGGESELRLKVW